jgi:Ca2+-binding EF-hand superfamily protein
MNPSLLLRLARVVLLAAGAWIVLQSSSVSAQTSGSEAIRMFDKDNDGTVDLGEAEAAAAALFDQLDRDHDGTLTQEELGDRTTVLRALSPSPSRFKLFAVEGKMTKDDYLALTEMRFKLADPDNDGKLDAKELESEAGQALLKLLR